MNLPKTKLDYLVMFRHLALHMRFAIDLLTSVTDRPTTTKEQGELFVDGNSLKYLDTSNNVQVFGKYDNNPPLHIDDTFTVDGSIVSKYEGAPETTSVGRYLLYAGVLEAAVPHVPYPNKAWSTGWLERLITDGLKNDTMTVKQAKDVINRVYRCGMFATMVVPTATEKSFTTDPAIAQRKKELLEQYAGQLDDPLVVAKIENELIAMDKDWVRGNPAMTYYDAMGSKSFNIHRKKMFIALGGVEKFDEKGQGYVFLVNALSEGWDPADFTNMVNELRKGSYSRGVDTMLGGALAKSMQRIFQNLNITAEDCGTTRGIEIMLTTDNVDMFVGRTVLQGDRKIKLDKVNSKSFIGRTVKMRSPMMCQVKDGGLCYVCSGDIFRQLDQKGISMEATAVAYTFQTQAMKAMHGTVIETEKVDYRNYLAANITH